MEMENLASEDEVRSLIKSERTHRDISILLQTKYPGITGVTVSERSVRRFCKNMTFIVVLLRNLIFFIQNLAKCSNYFRNMVTHTWQYHVIKCNNYFRYMFP